MSGVRSAATSRFSNLELRGQAWDLSEEGFKDLQIIIKMTSIEFTPDKTPPSLPAAGTSRVN